jgi:4-alpha-glucanotransferase
VIIEDTFLDWRGEWRRPPPETLEVVRSILGDDEPSSATSRMRCVVPTRKQSALAVQLYALWSDDSCGIGDLEDLATLARGVDADLLLLSPLHALLPGEPQGASPYFPSSRQFRNPMHLRVPGAAPDRPTDPIDRNRAYVAKMRALEDAWTHFGGADSIDAYRAAHGAELSRFATFCALSEKFDRPWRAWPAGVRHPDGRDIAGFALSAADRIRFHEWIQWQLDRQVATAAGAGPGLVMDLAVGFDPDGADAWMWQDVVAPGMHIGAPPDAFNREGQDWAVAPFVPAKLACAGFRPYVAALETAFAHAAGVRVDHVMGLFRQYWIPEGAPPQDGVYVRFPAPALLDLLALESQRTGAFVIGEDLGTVEPDMRVELRSRGVLSYRLLWFEPDRPALWPTLSVAAVTTHDLPTIAGVWEGADGSSDMRRRMADIVADDAASSASAIDHVHEELAEAPSLIVTRTLEDVLAVTERPNRPGTLDVENWSRPLPIAVGDIVDRIVAR